VKYLTFDSFLTAVSLLAEKKYPLTTAINPKVQKKLIIEKQTLDRIPPPNKQPHP
jgi:hypothetical protein